jgi:hypothetical protein
MSDISQLEQLIHLGHYARARNLGNELLTTDTSLRMKQLYALSLSKSGAPEAALNYLEPIARANADDAETNGILGGIYKELFKKNQSTKYAGLSRDTYEKNFAVTKSYYTGINAATMSMLAGQTRRGKEIAQEVLSILKDPDNDFWEAATQAEAFLLVKERAKSEQAFRRVREMASTDWGKISSVYNQLWLLNHYVPVPTEILRLFSPPVVMSFTGHMIDHPDRPFPRFPASIEKQIKDAIANAIRTLNAKVGYCSVACGADILFAEAMEEHGGEVNLYLPFRKEDFITSSVSFAGDHWVERFNRLVEKHSVTMVTPDAYENHPDLFNLTTGILFGLSCLRSVSSHKEPHLLTVLSERDPSRRTGGVRETLQLWPYPKNRMSINPDQYVPEVPGASGVSASQQADSTHRPVLYLVCCDLGTDEKQKAAVLQELYESGTPPSAVDVRDGYLVAGFRTIFRAMDFSTFAMKTFVKPFRQESTIRVSFHVAPIAIGENINQSLSGDAITTLTNLHVITLPGSYYATSMFAAVLALEPKKYSFYYVDTIPAGAAKDLDIFRVIAAGS